MAARAWSRAARGGGERASWSESTYTQLVDMMSRITAHKGCVMAHSKTLPAREEQTEQNSTSEGGNLDFSVDSASLFGFSCSLGSVTSNEATKSAMWSAEWNITHHAPSSALFVWNEISIFCPRMLQAERYFLEGWFHCLAHAGFQQTRCRT